MLTINSEKCTRCAFCVDECPNYVFSTISIKEGRWAEIRYPEQCCECGHCIAICPAGAIRHEQMPSEKFEDTRLASIPPDDMINLLLSRRSIRVFKDKVVPVDLLNRLIQTAIHAGTSSNGQTESFIVIQDGKTLAELEQMIISVMWEAGMKHMGSSFGRRIAKTKLGEEMLRQGMPYYHIIKNRKKDGELEGMIFRNAPTVIVGHGLRKNLLSPANCAIATRNMEILARSMDLGTCWVGFLSLAAHLSRKIGQYLEIPKDRNVYSAIMVGYPKHEYRKMIPRKDRGIRWR